MESKNVHEASEWGLASSRFSLFSSGFTEFDAAFFEDLFALSPESQTHKKAQFLSEFSATREQTVYQLSVTGPKIDIVVSADLQSADIPMGLPILRNGEEARTQMRRAAEVLIQRVNEARRLAVGEQTLKPAASRSEAYKMLAQLLPSVKIDAEGSSDLFYRVNRPRSIELGERTLVINRLSQWASIQLNVMVTAAEISKTAILGHAVSLLTDINSRAEDDLSSMPLENKKKLVDKLFAFSAEIAEKGDHP